MGRYNVSEPRFLQLCRGHRPQAAAPSRECPRGLLWLAQAVTPAHPVGRKPVGTTTLTGTEGQAPRHHVLGESVALGKRSVLLSPPLPGSQRRRGPQARTPQPAFPSRGSWAGEVGRKDRRPRRPLALKSQDRRRTFVARPGEGARAPSWTPGVSPPSASNLHWTRHHNAPGHVTVIAREGGSGLGDRPGSSSPRSSLNGRTFPHSLGSVPHCPAARRRQDTPQASRGAEVVAGGNA